jgi:hypothetical protein
VKPDIVVGILVLSELMIVFFNTKVHIVDFIGLLSYPAEENQFDISCRWTCVVFSAF